MERGGGSLDPSTHPEEGDGGIKEMSMKMFREGRELAMVVEFGRTMDRREEDVPAKD